MRSISKPLLKWFDQFGRHCLPWQATQDMLNNPYHVWLSEVMLQQTQVKTVINNFIQHFPTLASLSNTSEDAISAQWTDLWYYARARNLHTTANIIMNQYQGNFPTGFKQVIDLPGVGESTASAILAIRFNQNHVILDGNVKRVLSRYHQVKGHYGQSKTLKEIWHLARYHTPNELNADYTQAIMNLGATSCTQRKLDCEQCPIQYDCLEQQTNTQNQYPNPKPKKNKPTRSIARLIFRNDKHNIYLQKCPNKGILGGLWSFVECANNDKDIQQTITDFHPSALIEKSLTIFKHSFTHYHLLIHPILIHYPDVKGEFNPLYQLNIGVPKPVDNIICQLN